MVLLDISLESRVIIGISAMVLLFSSFLVVFISHQRKKLQYHKDLQTLNEQQQQALIEQNILLEDRVKERTAQLSEQKEVLQTTTHRLIPIIGNNCMFYLINFVELCIERMIFSVTDTEVFVQCLYQFAEIIVIRIGPFYREYIICQVYNFDLTGVE